MKYSKTCSNKSWSPSQIFIMEHFFGKIRPIFDAENDSENQNFEIFAKVGHNFGKSEDGII